jgi:hypothetical protein
MAGARANVSNETIEGLVRDVACPIQNLNNHATSMGGKCIQDCVKGTAVDPYLASWERWGNTAHHL